MLCPRKNPRLDGRVVGSHLAKVANIRSPVGECADQITPRFVLSHDSHHPRFASKSTQIVRRVGRTAGQGYEIPLLEDQHWRLA